MSSLDDIWDEPASLSTRPAALSPPTFDDDDDAPRTPARRRSSSQPLFLDSDSDTELPSNPNAPAAKVTGRYATKPDTNSRPDIDALFADLDEPGDEGFQDLAPSLDIDALRRQADARLPITPHQIMPSSSPPRDMGSDGEKGGKERKKGKDGGAGKKGRRRVLGEGALLGPDGFPALVRQSKDFQLKGKGHEVRLTVRALAVDQFPLQRDTEHLRTADRPEPTHARLPILDPQTLSQRAVPGHRPACREAMPHQTHARTSLPLPVVSYQSLALLTS